MQIKYKEIINDIMHLLEYHIIKKPIFKLRNSTKFVKENLKGDLIVVEIGTFRGINAESILKNLNVKKLYLIDPYYYESDDGSGVPQCDLEEAEREARERLSKFKNTEIIFIKKTSAFLTNNLPFVSKLVICSSNNFIASPS